MANNANHGGVPALASARRPWPAWLILVAGLVLGAALTLGAERGLDAWRAYQARPETFLAKNKAGDKAIVETPSGLQYKVLTTGKGPKPTNTDVVLISYVGKLTDGTVFDQSQQPTPLAVGAVVPGFSEALKLMQRGGKYRLWLKPGLGYGDKAVGPIPANAILVFDVDLHDFKSEAEIREIQRQRMAQGAAVPPPIQ